MWGKARYHDIILTTEKAILFLFETNQIWLPNKVFRYLKGKTIKLPIIFANQKNIKTEILQEYHVPKVIQPLYNQKAINQLVYEKISWTKC